MKTKLFFFFIFLLAFYQSINAQNIAQFQNYSTTFITANSAAANFDTRVASGSSGGTYTLRYSLNSDMSNPTIGGTGSVPLGNWQSRSVLLTGLTENTTYYWQVSGTVGNTTSLSQIISFTTLSNAVTAPTVLINTATSSVTSSQINYTINANNGATTSSLIYNTDPNNLTLSAVGFNATGNTNTTNSVTLNDLLPATTYYLRAVATNSAGTTTSELYNFTTNPALPPLITGTNPNPVGINTATILYNGNARGSQTTAVVNYGLQANNLNLAVSGASFGGNFFDTYQVNLINLTPNTTYYYQVVLTNAYGTATSDVLSFTTLEMAPQMLIANYPFNNSHNNSAGNSPFSATNTFFSSDRNNQSLSALSVAGLSSANIVDLPAGNNARSVSLWIRKGAITSPINIFKYGSNANLQTFGCYITTNGNYWFQGFGTDLNFGGTAPNDVWTHIVVTYSGTAVRLYINGTQLGAAQNINLNTGSSSFTIGHAGITIIYDDLNFYNFELTTAQVGELFNTNQLSVENNPINNLAFSMYPNPANDYITIDCKNTIKSVEIYSIQGQKVLNANQKEINISQLSTGVYLVRVEVENGAIATQKIIKK